MSALREAGIQIDPKQAFEALRTMGAEGFGNAAKSFEEAMEEEKRKGNGEGEGEKK